MGKRLKTGLDYFPVDVDFFEDEKVLLLSALYGGISELILIKLYAKIYRNGYFLNWDDDIALLFSRSFGKDIEVDFLNQIIQECLKRDLFRREVFEKYNILTSKGIQERYLEATKRRKKVDFYNEYLILPKDDVRNLYENVNIIPLNVNIKKQGKVVNDDICPQRKGKERKGKERKGKDLLVEVVKIWNKSTLKTGLPEVKLTEDGKIFSSVLENQISALWKSDIKFQNLDFWEEVFNSLIGMPHLLGQNDRRWVASLAWITNPGSRGKNPPFKNFHNIISGNYCRARAPVTPAEKRAYNNAFSAVQAEKELKEEMLNK